MSNSQFDVKKTHASSEMTSRKRVLMALNHQEPDRVPIDFGGMRSTGIMAIAYNHLKNKLKIFDGSVDVYDIGQQLAIVEESVLQRFSVDVVPLEFGTLGPWQPYELPDGTPARIPAHFITSQNEEGDLLLLDNTGRTVSRMPAGGLYFDTVYYPLAEATTVSELLAAASNLQTPSDGNLTKLSAQAQLLYEKTDYAIMGAFGGNILEAGQMLRGWEQFMLDLAAGDKFLETFLELLTEMHMQSLVQYLEAVGPYIQIIQMGDDLGTQAGPQISPRMYKRWIKPYQARIYRYVREHYPHILVFLHSCGGIYPFIPDLIDSGVQVLNPVQFTAKGMDSKRLKNEFGRDLTFWGGGCDTQHVLPTGTPEDVSAMVREQMDIFAPGGGFVFNQVHNIQADVPPENVIALFDTARKYGIYS